jgi:hypothetical protein
MTEDVFTEPQLDPHTLAYLGPLTGMVADPTPNPLAR